jgi:putative aminopeptidase FrvX
MPVPLGGGRALVHRDSMHCSRRLIGELRVVAEEHDIPVQKVVLYHDSSDGAHLGAAGDGDAAGGAPHPLLALSVRGHGPARRGERRAPVEAYLTESGTE